MEKNHLKSAIKGFGIAVLASVLMLALLNLAALGSRDPMKFLGVFAVVTMYTGALTGGFASVKFNHGKNGLICGLLAGAIYALVVFGTAVFVSEKGLIYQLVMALSLAAASALGGILGLGRGDTPEKHRKQMLKAQKKQNYMLPSPGSSGKK